MLRCKAVDCHILLDFLHSGGQSCLRLRGVRGFQSVLPQGQTQLLSELLHRDGLSFHGQGRGLTVYTQHIRAQVKGQNGVALPQGGPQNPGQNDRCLSPRHHVVLPEGAVWVGASEDSRPAEPQNRCAVLTSRVGQNGDIVPLRQRDAGGLQRLVQIGGEHPPKDRILAGVQIPWEGFHFLCSDNRSAAFRIIRGPRFPLIIQGFFQKAVVGIVPGLVFCQGGEGSAAAGKQIVQPGTYCRQLFWHQRLLRSEAGDREAVHHAGLIDHRRSLLICCAGGVGKIRSCPAGGQQVRFHCQCGERRTGQKHGKHPC